ncbi:hypothetical protein PROFUN_13741 [Planoprotostelium fungivorum]|uniref:Uncharacterized protein n=1 Tax=Planoprotostelium fungivorum TaxID=1890364 RepID=A0A2P6MWW6_9EUKA|nr:hypothetical protein PROFUN_13741 [Planoprotostelium fungivorum]
MDTPLLPCFCKINTAIYTFTRLETGTDTRVMHMHTKMIQTQRGIQIQIESEPDKT